jgi:hypothetical protein
MAFLTASAGSKMWRGLAACCFGALLLSLSLPCRAAGDGQELNEEKIKAGLLYNFLKYTDWPASAGTTLNVCLFQGDPFGGTLDPLKGRTAQQFRINILTIDGVSQLGGCNVVFIPAAMGKGVAEVLGSARGRNILTMSDMRGFAHLGGMVELAMREDQRIHILINQSAAQAAGLKIQPRMAKLAERAE